MTKLSNETSLINGVYPSQDRDASAWRALAEMNMTQLSHQFKKAMQEHKWSITICFYLYGLFVFFSYGHDRDTKVVLSKKAATFLYFFIKERIKALKIIALRVKIAPCYRQIIRRLFLRNG